MVVYGALAAGAAAEEPGNWGNSGSAGSPPCVKASVASCSENTFAGGDASSRASVNRGSMAVVREDGHGSTENACNLACTGAVNSAAVNTWHALLDQKNPCQNDVTTVYAGAGAGASAASASPCHWGVAAGPASGCTDGEYRPPETPFESVHHRASHQCAMR